MATQPGTLQFGLFADIYVVSLMVTKEIDGEDGFLKKLEEVRKLNLNSKPEATALVAFSSPVPDLFTQSGCGIYGCKECASSHFPKFFSWKEAGKEAIPHSIPVVKEGLINAINDFILSSSPVHKIMLLSMTESSSNLQALCEFLTSSTESLESFGLPTDQAWNLTT